jgi:hypothetical protein
MKKIDNFMKEKRMKLIELVCSCTNESSDYLNWKSTGYAQTARIMPVAFYMPLHGVPPGIWDISGW